jgi:hypothetical protein
METFLSYHPWIYFYLLQVAALAIAALWASRRRPAMNPVQDRRQDSD